MKNKIKSEVSMDLSEFLGLLKKYVFAILIIGIVCGLLVYATVSLVAVPQYEAGAKLIVNTKQDATMTITNDQITSSQKLADTYSIIVRSRSVLLPVIDELDLDMSYEQLQKHVTASSVDGTQIMQICVRDPDRQQAEQILREMLKISPDIILDSVEAGSVKTVENVYSLPTPVAPNKSLYTALAMLLGWILAVVFFVVKYLADDTYKSPEEIAEDLGVPVIGTIPRIS